MSTRQRLVAQAEIVQIAGLERLDQHVGPLDQAPKPLTASLGLDIDDDAAFVAAKRPPEQAVLRAGSVVDERAAATRGAAAGRLDLDHVRAEVGQRLPAPVEAALRHVDNAVGREGRSGTTGGAGHRKPPV